MEKGKLHDFKKKGSCKFTIMDPREHSSKKVLFTFFRCKSCGEKISKYEILEEHLMLSPSH